MCGETGRGTLHNGVLAVLGPAIVAGEYEPGHVFTLEHLEREYGVSRTVAREAVRVLQAMRLVHSRPRTGVHVRPHTEWSVFDPQLIRWRLAGAGRVAQLRSLTELRAAIEPAAAAAAARNAQRAQRESVVELCAWMTQAGQEGDQEEFLRMDIEFHRRILRLSGNEMFVGLAGVVAEVLAGRTEYRPPRPEALRLHTHVAEAVRDGLPRVARAAMRSIVGEADDENQREGDRGTGDQ